MAWEGHWSQLCKCNDFNMYRLFGRDTPLLDHLSHSLQKVNFNPNWTCRDVVTVFRIAPALLLGLAHV